MTSAKPILPPFLQNTLDYQKFGVGGLGDFRPKTIPRMPSLNPYAPPAQVRTKPDDIEELDGLFALTKSSHLAAAEWAEEEKNILSKATPENRQQWMRYHTYLSPRDGGMDNAFPMIGPRRSIPHKKQASTEFISYMNNHPLKVKAAELKSKTNETNSYWESEVRRIEGKERGWCGTGTRKVTPMRQQLNDIKTDIKVWAMDRIISNPVAMEARDLADKRANDEAFATHQPRKLTILEERDKLLEMRDINAAGSGGIFLNKDFINHINKYNTLRNSDLIEAGTYQPQYDKFNRKLYDKDAHTAYINKKLLEIFNARFKEQHDAEVTKFQDKVNEARIQWNLDEAERQLEAKYPDGVPTTKEEVIQDKVEKQYPDILLPKPKPPVEATQPAPVATRTIEDISEETGYSIDMLSQFSDDMLEQYGLTKADLQTIKEVKTTYPVDDPAPPPIEVPEPVIEEAITPAPVTPKPPLPPITPPKIDPVEPTPPTTPVIPPSPTTPTIPTTQPTTDNKGYGGRDYPNSTANYDYYGGVSLVSRRNPVTSGIKKSASVPIKANPLLQRRSIL